MEIVGLELVDNWGPHGIVSRVRVRDRREPAGGEEAREVHVSFPYRGEESGEEDEDDEEGEEEMESEGEEDVDYGAMFPPFPEEEMATALGRRFEREARASMMAATSAEEEEMQLQMALALSLAGDAHVMDAGGPPPPPEQHYAPNGDGGGGEEGAAPPPPETQ